MANNKITTRQSIKTNNSDAYNCLLNKNSWTESTQNSGKGVLSSELQGVVGYSFYDSRAPFERYRIHTIGTIAFNKCIEELGTGYEIIDDPARITSYDVSLSAENTGILYYTITAYRNNGSEDPKNGTTKNINGDTSISIAFHQTSNSSTRYNKNKTIRMASGNSSVSGSISASTNYYFGYNDSSALSLPSDSYFSIVSNNTGTNTIRNFVTNHNYYHYPRTISLDVSLLADGVYTVKANTTGYFTDSFNILFALKGLDTSGTAVTSNIITLNMNAMPNISTSSSQSFGGNLSSAGFTYFGTKDSSIDIFTASPSPYLTLNNDKNITLSSVYNITPSTDSSYPNTATIKTFDITGSFNANGIYSVTVTPTAPTSFTEFVLRISCLYVSSNGTEYKLYLRKEITSGLGAFTFSGQVASFGYWGRSSSPSIIIKTDIVSGDGWVCQNLNESNNFSYSDYNAKNDVTFYATVYTNTTTGTISSRSDVSYMTVYAKDALMNSYTLKQSVGGYVYLLKADATTFLRLGWTMASGSSSCTGQGVTDGLTNITGTDGLTIEDDTLTIENITGTTVDNYLAGDITRIKGSSSNGGGGGTAIYKIAY